MAKKIRTVLTLQLPAGKATPAPPVGTALGPHGINIVEFTKSYNEKTAAQSGQIIPAQITIFERDPVLFLYSEIRDEEAWDRLWHTEIHDKWGEIMNPLMEFNDAGIVDSSELREVFNLRTGAPGE